MSQSPRLIAVLITFAIALAVTPSSHAEPAPLDVLDLETPPEGRYSAKLTISGQEFTAIFEIKGSSALCVESEKAPGDRKVEGASGRFQLLANGVFIISLRGDGYTATQFWAWQTDGSALIKEIPDRGENQCAVPVAKE